MSVALLSPTCLIYFQFVLQIYRATAHCFQNRKKMLFVRLRLSFEYHKPYELNKIGDYFLMVFQFSFIEFSMKIYGNSFNKGEYGGGRGHISY